MQIGSIDLNRSVLVVAEIGNNHEGRLEVAEKLVRQAAEAGADAVKFQTYATDRFVSRVDEARYQRLKSFELSYDQFESLSKLARGLGLLFISTPLDLESAAFLEKIVDAFKIASGDNDFYPLIERVARFGKPMIVSTGLSDAAQVQASIDVVLKILGEARTQEALAILHCVCAYPVPDEQANLLSIPWLARHSGLTVGYSDHTLGIDAAVLAVALGARIIEKHFTLDKNYSDFRDHKISADPDEMRRLVRRVRQATALLGTTTKAIQPVETPALPVVRRSIAAGRPLPRGHEIQSADLVFLRPAGGFPPGQEASVVGRTVLRDIPAGTVLKPADLAPRDS